MRRQAFIIQLILMSSWFPSFGQVGQSLSPPEQGQEVEEHLTSAQRSAAQKLLAVLRNSHAFSTIRPECLLLEFEEDTKEHIQFAVRFDQSKCGGNSPSNLIDRFAVQKHSKSILYYDVTEDRFRSFKWFLKHRNW